MLTGIAIYILFAALARLESEGHMFFLLRNLPYFERLADARVATALGKYEKNDSLSLVFRRLRIRSACIRLSVRILIRDITYKLTAKSEHIGAQVL